MNWDPANESPKTISVPEAGRRYFDLSRNSAYAAAARGDIPTIRIGRLLRVPVLALDRQLERVADRMHESADPRNRTTH